MWVVCIGDMYGGLWYILSKKKYITADYIDHPLLQILALIMPLALMMPYLRPSLMVVSRRLASKGLKVSVKIHFWR